MSKYDKDAQHWLNSKWVEDRDTRNDNILIVVAFVFIVLSVLFLDQLADWFVGL